MGRKWTQHEMDTVRRMYCTTSMTIPEIAEVVGRSSGGVSAKIGTMAIVDQRCVVRT